VRIGDECVKWGKDNVGINRRVMNIEEWCGYRQIQKWNAIG